MLRPIASLLEIEHPRLRLGQVRGGGKAEFVLLAWPEEPTPATPSPCIPD
ncbi:MAG: hypothetical protein R2911_26140 [Caldilineaceae bacterium]